MAWRSAVSRGPTPRPSPWHDLGAPSRARGQHPVVEDLVLAWRRNDGGESLDQFQRREVDGDRAVGPGSLHPESHPVSSEELQPGPSKRRTADVPTQLTESLPVGGADDHPDGEGRLTDQGMGI